MSDNLTIQTGGHLLVLPSEVRLLIYEMIFPPCRTGLYAAAADFRWGREDQDRHPALLATCRAIYAEAKPVLYANTEFQVWLSYFPEPEPAEDEDTLSEASVSEDSVLRDSPSEDSPSEQLPAENPSLEATLSEDLETSGDDHEARLLIGEMRKLSLEITLVDHDMWTDPEDRSKWYGGLAATLTSLSEAPHLKQVHIELDAAKKAGIVTGLDEMINLLSRVPFSIVPTILIQPSLRSTDFAPSTYFDLMAKLNW